jgi:hypothetical protein
MAPKFLAWQIYSVAVCLRCVPIVTRARERAQGKCDLNLYLMLADISFHAQVTNGTFRRALDDMLDAPESLLSDDRGGSGCTRPHLPSLNQAKRGTSLGHIACLAIEMRALKIQSPAQPAELWFRVTELRCCRPLAAPNQ